MFYFGRVWPKEEVIASLGQKYLSYSGYKTILKFEKLSLMEVCTLQVLSSCMMRRQWLAWIKIKIIAFDYYFLFLL